MKTLPLVWRIYLKGRPAKNIGTVEAFSEQEALDKAIAGSWKAFWATERETVTDVALIYAQA